jgi:hypothetical protein
VYRHCMFCNADLGVNEALEPFPIGRRLAFDPALARLWVICRACTRWNLSPLEERWEALEECDRLYRDSKLKVATEHIGLSRVPDDVELVRIGPARDEEFAAWRYGDQLQRRRRRVALSIGIGAGAVIAGTALTSTLLGAVPGLIVLSTSLNALKIRNVVRRSRPIRLRTETGRVDLTGPHLNEVTLLPGRGGGWRLSIPAGGTRSVGRRRLPSEVQRISLTGEDAVQAAGPILARMNRLGASGHAVSAAVDFLQNAGSPSQAYAVAADTRRTWLRYQVGDRSLVALPRVVRLALEMAAHEESERRALEGELAALEEAWKEAEEIASIADDLLVPESVTRLLQRWRDGRSS